MRYPTHLMKVITLLKKLPGVGSRSAERYAFQMLQWKNETLSELGNLIQEMKRALQICSTCGCLMEKECYFCPDPRRDQEILCVVATQKEVFSFEETALFKGRYHVLGSLFSPMEGKRLDPENLEKLEKRIIEQGVKEVILALDSTLEGDATALFLCDQLRKFPIKISRLAFGLPLGSALEYVDESTLACAFKGRSFL